MLTLFTKILGDSTSSSGYVLAQLLGALAGTGIAYGLVHDTIQTYLNLQHDSRWTYDLLGPMLYTQPTLDVARTRSI